MEREGERERERDRGVERQRDTEGERVTETFTLNVRVCFIDGRMHHYKKKISQWQWHQSIDLPAVVKRLHFLAYYYNIIIRFRGI